MATLYDRIKSRRTELGLTVEELAHKMGYKDKSSISKIENGKADIPQSKIAAFADAPGTTPAYLMGWEEQPTPTAPIPPGFIPMPKMRKDVMQRTGGHAIGSDITDRVYIHRAAQDMAAELDKLGDKLHQMGG